MSLLSTFAFARFGADAMGSYYQQSGANSSGGGLQLNYRWYIGQFLLKPFGEIDIVKGYSNKKIDSIYHAGVETSIPVYKKWFVAPTFLGASIFNTEAFGAGLSLGYCLLCNVYGEFGFRDSFSSTIERFYIRSLIYFGDTPLYSVTVGVGFVF